MEDKFLHYFYIAYMQFLNMHANPLILGGLFPNGKYEGMWLLMLKREIDLVCFWAVGSDSIILNRFNKVTLQVTVL